jgi:acyl CoA:acetate/3-ketoacid CoA transferase alpha subunit/acyl CoA:acetate/3-ketoacid CoA transferase beta subunit
MQKRPNTTGESRPGGITADLRARFAPPTTYQDSKVVALEDALRTHVRPGMMLHFAYNQARAMALSNALVRVFAGTNPGFTIVSAGLVANQTALFTTGLIRKLIVSFVGENYPVPSPNRIMQEAITSGSVAIENQSLLVIAQRLAAGAFGFPFALTRSLAGSSMATGDGFREIDDPFGSGERIGAAPALVPDITLVHALAADPQGNLLLSQPLGDGEIAAFAASRGVIATVERVVSPDVIRRFPHLNKIPAHRVLSVSEAPLGCHPYGLYSPPGLEVAGYVEDYDFFADIHAVSKSATQFDAWEATWISGCKDNDAYLAKLGTSRIEALRAGALPGAWEHELDEPIRAAAARTEFDPIDAMVAAAARIVGEKVHAHGHGIVAAGVGYANLAAWLAVSELQQRDGLPVELVAEIGLYGFFPQPGEPFIFSNRNIATCKALTTAEAVLGLHVSGRHNRCLALIGAAQVDTAGNINSTYTDQGKFLVGSGGANDIASAAAEVIVIAQQARQRLVSSLPYITSIGRRVSTLVTDLGVYQKRKGTLVLTGYFPNREDDVGAALAKIRSTCGWPLVVADHLEPLAPPSPEALQRIRLYDRRGEFLTSVRAPDPG